MSTLLKPRRRATNVEYEHHWSLVGDPNSGYFLPCNEKGAVEADKKPRYDEFMADSNLIYKGIRRLENRYWEPGKVRCDCGQIAILHDAWLNECTCGADYDGNGSRLAPRSQWGWDTGESLADILTGPGEDW